MEALEARWATISDQIEKGIDASESGRFAISDIRLKEEMGLSDQEWLAMLEINKRRQKFAVEYYLDDWSFRGAAR